MTTTEHLVHQPTARLRAPHPSVYALIGVIALLTAAALYHIALQPYPNQWDDSVYANATFDWLEFIRGRDLLRGLFWGAIYELPRHMPPMVFFTSVAGGLVGGTLAAMRIAQLAWFVVLLVAVYGIGQKLIGGWAGVVSALMAGTTSLIFFWSTTVMGEPALFALIAVTLALLVRQGDRPALWRGAILGISIGLGLLTKQHYLVSVAGPLALWALWLGLQVWRRRLPAKPVVVSLAATAIAALLIAGPWYALNVQEVLRYASQSDFPLHTLGPVVSWYTVSTYFGILIAQLGWPAMLLFAFGAVWAAVQCVAHRSSIGRDWRTMSVLLLLISGLTGLVVALMIRNLNTRFIIPAFVSWAALSGLALSDMWIRHGTLARVTAAAAIALQLTFWWSQSFGPDLPPALALVTQNKDLRPADMTLLNKTWGVLEQRLPPDGKSTFWVVGNYHSFNQPTFANLVTERGHDWQVLELYHWDDTETSVQAIVDRIGQGDIVAVYKQDWIPKAEGEKLVSRYDDAILQALQSATGDFEPLTHADSDIAHDQVWIYARRGSDGATTPPNPSR